MICPECGESIRDEARYCERCGSKINGNGSLGEVQQGLVGGEALLRRPAGDQEVEIWQGGYSPRAMIGHWVTAGVISVVVLAAGIIAGPSAGQIALLVLSLLGIWLALYLLLLYRQWSVHYRLTNHRFVHRSGLLKRVTDRVEVIDIDDVGFQQGLFERIFGVGTVELSSSDQTHPYLRLKGIADVERVAGLIDNARRDERRKRGLHIESI
jgi:uncharacterized membrane protein YdbT with pleckstrin-like domain